MGIKAGTYYVDNAPIREAVQLAVRSGEVSFSMLAGELGHRRPHPHTLRVSLGIIEYATQYKEGHRSTLGMKAENARRVFDLVAPEGEKPEDWLVPVGRQFFARRARREERYRYSLKVWGNGTQMVYSWRVRILVENAIREGRTTMAQLSRELGHMKNDAAPLKRALGLKKANGNGDVQTKMDEDMAIWLCHRLGYDPVDWGI